MDLNHRSGPASFDSSPCGNLRRRHAAAPARLATFSALGALVACAVLVALGGCGGGEGEASAAPPAGAAKPVALAAPADFMRESPYAPGEAPGQATQAAAHAEPIATEPSAVPVDRQARTRAGRYLSRATAERLDREAGGSVVWADAACCAGHDPELAERIVFGMQAVLGEDSGVFVVGSDLRQAARLADRLESLGVRRVHLVTP
jgi:hypothetical protein